MAANNGLKGRSRSARPKPSLLVHRSGVRLCCFLLFTLIRTSGRRAVVATRVSQCARTHQRTQGRRAHNRELSCFGTAGRGHLPTNRNRPRTWRGELATWIARARHIIMLRARSEPGRRRRHPTTRPSRGAPWSATRRRSPPAVTQRARAAGSRVTVTRDGVTHGGQERMRRPPAVGASSDLRGRRVVVGGGGEVRPRE